METIEVFYKGLGPQAQDGTYAAYHKYLVYTDSAGNKRAARGGPAKDVGYFEFSSDGVEVNGESPHFGAIATYYGAYADYSKDEEGHVVFGFVDYDREGDDPSELIASSSDLSTYWEAITEALDDISAAGYSYGPVGQNSNAVVDAALEQAALPAPQLDGVLDHWAPGSDFPLFFLHDTAGYSLLPDWMQVALFPIIGTPGVDYAPGVVLGGGDPLVFDLDGDSLIEMTSVDDGVHFDFWGDGFAEKTGWVGADDGMLVWDKDADGLIEGFSEMVASAHPLGFLIEADWETFEEQHGFAQLALLDGNSDGVIDASDAAYTVLQIWQDVDQDGVSDAGELHSLASLNIASIDVAGAELDSFAGMLSGGFTRIIEGNTVTHSSTFTMTDSSTREVVDIWFDQNLQNSYYANDYLLDVRTLFLPTLRGYGTITDLHIAMSQDETLLDDVQAFATERTFEEHFDEFAEVRAEVRDILMRWAGVDDTDSLPTDAMVAANGLFSYMAEYHFLAKLTGIDSPYLGTWFDGRPFLPIVDEGVQAVSQSWDHVLDAMVARLVFQSGGIDLFANDPAYNPASDTFEGDLSLSETAIGDLETALSSHADLAGAWRAVAVFLENTVGLANLSGTEITWLDDAVDGSSASSLSWADILDTLEVQEIDGVAGNDTVNGTPWDDILNEEYSGGLNDGNETLYGFEGNDILHGGDGDDILVGGAGNDTYYGGWGSDTYVYDSGHDVIDDLGGNSVIVDTEIIQFAAGITPEDVTLKIARTDTAYTDHYILEVAGRGTITIKNDGAYWTTLPQQVDELHFADSTVLSFPELDAIVYGTQDDDVFLNGLGFSGLTTIYGFAGDDTIGAYGAGDFVVDGGDGDDVINGGEGDDTYIVSAGDDFVIDTSGGFDVILIPTGYSLEDVTFLRTDLDENGWTTDYQCVTIVVAGLGSITIARQLIYDQDSDDIVEKVHFADDETVVDLTDQIFEVKGTDGDDLFRDTYQIPGSDDIYHFGIGNDALLEEQGGYDVLVLPDGLTADDVTITRGASLNGWGLWSALVIDDGLGNSFTVEKHFSEDIYSGNPDSHSLERILFSDASFIDLATTEIATYGTSGNDYLEGVIVGDASDDDQLFGLAGNDQLYGRDGDDYLDGGAGNDTVLGEADDDTLAYVLAENASASDTYDGDAGFDTLELRFTSAEYNSTLQSELQSYWTFVAANYDEASQSGSSFNFTNIGLSAADIEDVNIYVDGVLQSGIPVTGTSGNDSLSGGDAPEEIHGLAGSDTIYGNGNDDFIYGDEGNDTLYGGDGDDTMSGGTGNDTVRGGAGDDTLYLTDGTNQLYGGDDADTFVIDSGSFNTNNGTYANVDYIHDFDTTEGDRILIDYVLEGYVPGTSDITDFVLLSPISGDTRVYVDRDGTGSSYSSQIAGWLENVSLSDEQALLNSGALVVTVNPPPVAQDDAFSGTEDQEITGNLLSDNGSGADSDPDSDPLSVYAETKSTTHGGMVAILANGNFTYTPVADFFGEDGFTYTLEDDGGATDIGAVTLNVENVNDAPVAEDDEFTGQKNDDIIGNLLSDNGNGADSDADDDTLSVVAETKATSQGGSVVILSDGSFTYTPDTDFTGIDSFTYTLEDGESGDDTGSVSLTVTAFNVITGTSSGETLTGTSGADEIHGLAGSDTLYGNEDDDLLYGDDGGDTLYGGDGDDVMWAGNGNDTLRGGNGDDSIYFAAGTNQLYGGNDADAFVVDAGSFDADSDYVNDFDIGEGDVIRLEDVLTGYTPGTSDITDFVLLSPTGGDTRLFVDRDGTGSTYSSVRVAYIKDITATDEQAWLNNGTLVVEA